LKQQEDAPSGAIGAVMAAKKKTSGRGAPADGGDPAREVESEEAEPARADVRRAPSGATPTQYAKGGNTFAFIVLGLMALAILASLLID
jgi:hypothetical protein